MEWYLGPLRKYAVFNGRASRKEYWLFSLCQVVIALVLSMVSAGLYLVYVLGTLLPHLGVTIRRLHDTNRRGWWLFVSLVPLVGGIVMLVFLASRGTDGDNDHGSDPRFQPQPGPGSPIIT